MVEETMIKATIKDELPKVTLPENYTIRMGRNVKRKSGNSYMCPEDIKAWKNIQCVCRPESFTTSKQTLNSFSKFSKDWYNIRYLISPLNGDWVIFAEYKNEVVGACCIIITDNRLEFHHMGVLPEHRRKGIYRAMMITRLNLAKTLGFTYGYMGTGQQYTLKVWRELCILDIDQQNKISVDEFKKRHNEVIMRHVPTTPDTCWDYKWFLNRVLDRETSNRFGWFINTVDKYLKDGMKVIDLCGGIGMFGTFLHVVEGYNFNYFVFDVEKMKAVVEDYFKTFGVNGSFIAGNICLPLPIQENTFDMAWLFSWCTNDCINCETFFADVYRILKPNGIFMFNMAYEDYATIYTINELTDLLTKIGFRIEIMEKDKSGYAKEYFVVVRK